MRSHERTFICAPRRTPIGSFLGSLSSLSAPELGSRSIQSTMKMSGLSVDSIDAVYMGCVLTSGVGQAPARQAALKAGLPLKTPCTTVGKVCGSGLKAVMLADVSLRAGEAQAILAGGMESMSKTPHLLMNNRQGYKLGSGELVDSMIRDGLWDVYNNFHMGNAAELCAREFKMTREAQDAYAAESYKRAQHAISNGFFKNEITPIDVVSKKSTLSFVDDEEPLRGDVSKFAQLKPVFESTGTVTAANASTLNDGAASMVVCTEEFAKKNNLKVFAEIISQSESAAAPEWFTTAPATAIELALKKAKLKTSDIDLWEINEAFAVVALANMKLLGLDPQRVNIHGGAVALGHPIGASGARILVTLCHALKLKNLSYGVASLCIGGGEAVALLIKNVP